MYCQNCGSKIEEGSKFCTNCGTEVEDDQKVGVSNTQSTPSDNKPSEPKSIKLSRKNIITIAGVLLIAIVAFAGIKFMQSWPQKISMEDYIDVEFIGADGYGDISYDFNNAKFINDYKGKIKIKENDNNFAKNSDYIVEDLAYLFEHNVTINYEPTENLSNGDNVKVDYNIENIPFYENKYNIELASSSKEYKVDGLMEVKE